MWMTFLWLSLDLDFGKPNDGLCYVALSFVSLRLVLCLIWVFGIECDMLEFSIEFGIEFEIEFGEFDMLEIGIECGKLSSFVHNGFP